MEDFLREKLDGLEHDYSNDWPEFEEKLERALFFKRMKVGAVVSAFLILLSIGIFGTSSFMGGPPPETFAKPGPVQNTESQHQLLQEERRTAPEFQEILEPPALDEGSFINEETSLVDMAEFAKTSARPVLAEKTEKIKPTATDAAKASKIASNEMPRKPVRSKTAGAADSEKIDQNKRKAAEALPVENALDDVQNATAVENSRPDISPTKHSSGKPSKNNENQATALAVENPLEVDGGDITASAANITAPKLTGALDNDALHNSELEVKNPIENIDYEAPDEGPYISPMQEENPWSLSLSVYPNFTFRKFKVDREKLALIHRDFIDATQSAERGGFSLNIGFKVSRRIGPVTYLNSGAEYINYKTQAEFDFTHFRDATINDETGEILHYKLKSNPDHISFAEANLYHYLNIPLSISHKPWATDHIQLNIEAGASFMYFLTATGRSLNYRTLEIIDLSEREYRNQIGSFSMKVGATYYVSPKFNVGFEPTMVYFTNTIYTEEYPFRVIPYSVGVNLKLQMKLN